MHKMSMFLVAAGAIAACQSFSAARDEPALLVDPTAATRAELLMVMTRALGAPVVLAADALTATSLLSVERNPPRDISGAPLTGRTLGRPEQFRLVLGASGCELVHLSNGDRFELREARCVAE